jgi:hypothetical protein
VERSIQFLYQRPVRPRPHFLVSGKIRQVLRTMTASPRMGMDDDLSTRLTGLNVNIPMNGYHPPPLSPTVNPYFETPRTQAPYSPLPSFVDDGISYYYQGLASPFQSPQNVLPNGQYPYNGQPCDGMSFTEQTHFPSLSQVFANTARGHAQTPQLGGFANQQRSGMVYRPPHLQQGYQGGQVQVGQQQTTAQQYGFGNARYYGGLMYGAKKEQASLATIHFTDARL